MQHEDVLGHVAQPAENGQGQAEDRRRTAAARPEDTDPEPAGEREGGRVARDQGEVCVGRRSKVGRASVDGLNPSSRGTCHLELDQVHAFGRDQDEREDPGCDEEQ